MCMDVHVKKDEKDTQFYLEKYRYIVKNKKKEKPDFAMRVACTMYE